jgi:hypothetical protein
VLFPAATEPVRPTITGLAVEARSRIVAARASTTTALSERLLMGFGQGMSAQ